MPTARKTNKRHHHRIKLIALVTMQLFVVPPALVWHLHAAAQDSADGGEGADPCSPPKENTKDDTEVEAETGEDDEQGDKDVPDDSGVDGGDRMDGSGAPADPGGTDGDGGDIGGDPGDFVGGDSGDGEGGADFIEGMSSMADPIDLRYADKGHVQVDYVSRGAGRLRLARVYHSNQVVFSARVSVPMGTGWRMYYDRGLQVLSGSQVRLHRANGRVMDFNFNGQAWVSALPGGALTAVAGGWQYVNHRNAIETYDGNGRLLNMSKAGLTATMQYDGAGRLASVSNPFGRSLALSYDGAGRVAGITLPDGHSVNYGYDSRNNLVSTTFADGNSRRYAYENGSYPNALTGVVDESGRRRVTWGYDGQGRPNYSHYGTGSNAVNIVYNGDQVTTTDARGTQRVRNFATVGQRRVLTLLQTAATADSAATAWSFAYDGNGNPSSVTTRTGEVRQFSLDGRARALSATRAAGTAQALSASSIWHPVFRKPTQTTHLGVTRNFTIDGVGRVTQVTQTAGGATSTVGTRSYNAQNLLQSRTDARGATTRYTYDAAGNRITATDALNQTTYFQNHTPHGQPTRIQRPDGTVITRSFDARGRLSTRSVAGITTSYDYDAANRLTRTSVADGSWVAHSYDEAGHRTGSSNHRSEFSSAQRDAAGKIINQSVYSASGTLAQMSARQYNAVNRLAAVLDSRNYSTQVLYAADGRVSGQRDPLNRTQSYQRDPLDRITTHIKPNTTAMLQAGGAATVAVSHAYHPTTATYTSTVDTNAVATNYSYNSLNQRTAESAADSGGKSYTRNVAGDVTSTTDGRGNVLNIGRDALGRVTSVTPATGTGITYSYLPGSTAALPTQMTDPSGSTAWAYDSATRVISKAQTIGGVTRTLRVTRDSLGRPVSMVYPSGMRLDAVYTGDVLTSLSVNGVTLLNNIRYRPMSTDAAGWLWGNGSSYSRSFDADGRMTSVTLGAVLRSYSYDPAGRVNRFVDQRGASTQASDFVYDEAGQLTSYTGPQGSYRYAYDANGNRRTTTINGNVSTQTYAAGTNRLLTSPRGTFSYNADGNPSSDGWMDFTYDVYGRLTKIGNAEDRNARTYNGQGMRVISTSSYFLQGGVPLSVEDPKRSSATTSVGDNFAASAGTVTTGEASTAGENKAAVRLSKQAAATPSATAGSRWVLGSTHQFMHTDDGKLLGDYGSSGTTAFQETIWFNGMPVGTMVNGVLYAISADNLGTPRAINRASDNLEVWRWDSEPFGNTWPTNPAVGSGIVIEYNLRFAGQQYDGYSGYYYNWMRDYDPFTGRYLQADPIGLGGGLSRFTYVSGDPLDEVDPVGLAGGRTSVPRAPSQMAETGGWGSSRSVWGQFTNLPNPGVELPGDFVGVNYPWSMPRLIKICDGPYPADDSAMCKAVPTNPNGPSMSAPGMEPTRSCSSWHYEYAPQ